MRKTVRAKISWIPASAGGRKRQPAGPIYSTVASFEDDWGQSPLSWSIIAEFLQADEPESGCTLANIRFLAPNAPVGLLYPGSRFQLFEGPRLVATGEVWQILGKVVLRSCHLSHLLYRRICQPDADWL